MKKFQGSLWIMLVIFLFSCKNSSESKKEVEFILDTFNKFYNVHPDSRILIVSNFSNKNNIYDLTVIDIENIEPPYEYLGLQALKSNYKTHTVFYTSSSNHLLSNQLNWSVYHIKKQNEKENLDEDQPWYDFKELRFFYNKNSDSLRVIPPVGKSFWISFPE